MDINNCELKCEEKDELKLCPMCAGTAVICVAGSDYSIWCENCHLNTAERPSLKEAIALWNRRAYELLHEYIFEYQMLGYSRQECVDALRLGRNGY